MKSLTLKERLHRYLKKRPGVFISSGELQRLTTERTKYTAANATRRLRELAEDGLIEVEYVKGHAHYKYQPSGTEQVRTVQIIDGRAVETITTQTI